MATSIARLHTMAGPDHSTMALIANLLAVDEEAMALCRNLDADQLSWRPQPDKWSIAENLAHLRSTTEVFLPVIDAALGELQRRELRSQGPFILKPYGRFLVWCMETRLPIRMRAPRALAPCPIENPLQELAAFLATQAEVRARIELSEGYDLVRLRSASPLMCCVHFNLLELFLTFAAHARRHLRQAQRVRCLLPRTSQFPALASQLLHVNQVPA